MIHLKDTTQMNDSFTERTSLSNIRGVLSMWDRYNTHTNNSKMRHWC